MTGLWTPSSFAWKTLEDGTEVYYNSATEMVVASVAPAKEVAGCFTVLAAPHMLAHEIYLSKEKAKAGVERGVTRQLNPSASKGR